MTELAGRSGSRGGAGSRGTDARAPAIVLLPTGAGGVLDYAPLTPRLPPGHPVLLLPFAGDGHLRHGARSVESRVRRQLAALLETCPQGPFVVAGFSFGGSTAFELAHQLVAADHEVPLLVLLDAGFPNPAAHSIRARLSAGLDTGLARRTYRWLRRLLRQAAGDVRHARTTRLEPDDGVPKSDAATGTGARPEDLAQQRADLRTVRSGKALHRYRPRPYGGRTLIVCSAEGAALADRWSGYLTGPTRTVFVPGKHVGRTGILSERNAPAVALALARALAEAAPDPLDHDQALQRDG